MTERPPPGSPPTAGEQDSPSLTPGWCAREIEQELPGLRLLSTQVDVGREGSLTGESPTDVRRRLSALSNRFRGAAAIAVRRDPVPSAYRVFYRHIGLTPRYSARRSRRRCSSA